MVDGVSDATGSCMKKPTGGTGLSVMVVRLGTTLDVPAWQPVKSRGSVAV